MEKEKRTHKGQTVRLDVQKMPDGKWKGSGFWEEQSVSCGKDHISESESGAIESAFTEMVGCIDTVTVRRAMLPSGVPRP